MLLKFTRHAREWTVDSETLPSLDYLLQYGLAQSCQDAIAGCSKATWEDCAEQQMKKLDMLLDKKAVDPYSAFRAMLKTDEKSAKVFAEWVKQETVKAETALIEKRIAAIESNSVGSRAGQSGDAVDVEIRALARANLGGYVKSKGMKMPKDNDLRNELLAEYVKLADDILRPVAEANVKAAAKLRERLGKILPNG